jgi:hypothetical protein
MTRAANIKRIYFVRVAGVCGMVRATSKAAAYAHVIRDMVAEIASQDSIVEWMSSGHQIEDAADPEPKAE